LWLAETSQQPISQTTWLKVTPNCNHCNHWTTAISLRRWKSHPAEEGQLHLGFVHSLI
jgi:hypothetical protein